MMEILIVILALSVLGICIFMKCITELGKRIDELEKKIDNLQYQTDDVLHDINIVNKNVLSTSGMLAEMKDEINKLKKLYNYGK